MTSLWKSKQGLHNSVLAAIIFLLLLGIISIIGYVLYDNIMSAAAGTPLLGSPESLKAKAGFDNMMNSWDYIIFFVMIILLIGIIVTTYTIATPPIIFVVTFVMAPIIGFIGYVLSIFFYDFATNGIISAVMSHFKLTYILLTNLHWVALLMIIIGSITLYAKRDKGQYM